MRGRDGREQATHRARIGEAICRRPPPNPPNEVMAPSFLLRGSRRESQGRKFWLVCSAQEEEKGKRERWRNGKRTEKGKVAGAADFYSWAAPSLDGPP